MTPSWAVFLDRDGVLVADREGFITQPEHLGLLPGVGPALKRLKQAGALLIVATNQPAVARGLVDEDGLAAIHRKLEGLLEAEGAALDALYYCPHHPETHHPEANDPRYRRECDCRKPKPGMLFKAADRFGLDLGRSFMIGDTERDVLAAHNAGSRAVTVKPVPGADAAVGDIGMAADWILEHR